MSDERAFDLGRDLHPQQDPSALTSAQLFRELANLELRINDQIQTVKESAELIHTDYTRVPTLLDRAIGQLRELMETEIHSLQSVTNEKFAGVQTQFAELNLRTSQLKTASDTAIAAAMAAAEKAVGENNRSFSLAVAKSENTTVEALRNLDALSKTENRATNDKVAILASRLDKLDGSNSTLLAMGAAIVAILSLLLAGYSAFHGNSPYPQPVVQYAPTVTSPTPVIPK